jgi:hypothetical protein
MCLMPYEDMIKNQVGELWWVVWKVTTLHNFENILLNHMSKWQPNSTTLWNFFDSNIFLSLIFIGFQRMEYVKTSFMISAQNML